MTFRLSIWCTLSFFSGYLIYSTTPKWSSIIVIFSKFVAFHDCGTIKADKCIQRTPEGTVKRIKMAALLQSHHFGCYHGFLTTLQTPLNYCKPKIKTWEFSYTTTEVFTRRLPNLSILNASSCLLRFPDFSNKSGVEPNWKIVQEKGADVAFLLQRERKALEESHQVILQTRCRAKSNVNKKGYFWFRSNED